MVLLDTLSDLNKLNYGLYSKYQLYSPKIDIAHVDILSIQSGSRGIKMLSDTLSDLVNLNHSKYSKYHVHQNLTCPMFVY